MARISKDKVGWSVSIYYHSEMFDESFCYRAVLECLLIKLSALGHSVSILNNDPPDDWDSMKTFETVVNGSKYKIYWEREIGHITAYCNDEKSADKISCILHEIWPNESEVPFVL